MCLSNQEVVVLDPLQKSPIRESVWFGIEKNLQKKPFVLILSCLSPQLCGMLEAVLGALRLHRQEEHLRMCGMERGAQCGTQPLEL